MINNTAKLQNKIYYANKIAKIFVMQDYYARILY